MKSKKISNCCGATYRWIKDSCNCGNESSDECYKSHRILVCSKCYK